MSADLKGIYDELDRLQKQRDAVEAAFLVINQARHALGVPVFTPDPALQELRGAYERRVGDLSAKALGIIRAQKP